MIKNRDFIVVGLQALDSRIGSNCINIAQEIARNNRVLYVNYPLDRLTKIREKNDPLVIKRNKINKGLEPDLVQVSETMWNLYPKTTLESISQLPVTGLFDWLNKINNKRFAREIKKAIEKLKFRNFFRYSFFFTRSFLMCSGINPQDFIIFYILCSPYCIQLSHQFSVIK